MWYKQNFHTSSNKQHQIWYKQKFHTLSNQQHTMDHSTCQLVKQFMFKYPKTNIVDIVNLCNNIVSIGNEQKTGSTMYNQKSCPVWQLRCKEH